MSWQIRPLSEIADFVLGKMLDQAKNRGELLPYLANVNVRWGDFDLSDLREMRFEPHEVERYSLKPGDIVMCEGGEPGRCALWKGQREGMMIQKALHRIRPRAGLDSTFLYYAFLNIGNQNGFAPFFTGATIKHLPREQLARVPIRLPEWSEQRAIAVVLSAYDDLIATNQRRIALLEDAARRLYREWFVHLRFPGHESVPVKDRVPEGWQISTFGKQISIRKGKNLTKSSVIPGEVPVVAAGLGPMCYHNTANTNGPVITVSASGANAGYVRLYHENIWVSDCSYISNNVTDALYFFYCALKERQTEILLMQKGAAQPHVYPKDIQAMDILLPSPKVVALFQDHVASMFALCGTLLKQNGQLSQARDLLLPKLMSGQLDVSGIALPDGVAA